MSEPGECKRIILWCTWVLNLLISAVYVLMSWATCNKLVFYFQELKVGYSNHIWRAPIAAAALGGVMVATFQLLSCFILIRKSLNKNTGPGFGYGFIVAWCFVLSFLTLLCGLVMQGFTSVVQEQLQPQTNWTSRDTGAFQGTYCFAYICSGMFLFFFLCLLIFQTGVTKQLGIYEQMLAHKRFLEMNALAGTGTTGAMTMQAMAAQQI